MTSTLPSIRRQAGFTLIELLVVISIIALLISVLLPALSAAREAAKGSECLSRERQVMMAVRLYSDDWYGGGRLMSAFMYNPALINNAAPYQGRLANQLWPNRIAKRKTGYLPNLDTARCPSNTNPRTGFTNYATDENIAYGMREYTVWDKGSPVGYDVGDSYLITTSESQWPILADSIRSSGGVATQGGPQISFVSSWDGSTHLRHNDTANMIYADGHGEAMSRDALKGLHRDHTMFFRTIVGPNGEPRG